MGSSQGALAQLGMTDAGTPDEAFDFVSEDIKYRQELIYNAGIRGTRSRHESRVALGIAQVGGSVTMTPNPTEIDRILPRMGFTESADVFSPVEALPAFVLAVDRVAKVHTFSGCKVASAVFSGSQNQPLQLVLNILAVNESLGNAGTFPSLTIPAGDMYVFHQGVLTTFGTARTFDDFTLTIDNLANVRHANSVTATDIDAQDRQTTLSVSTPYTSSETDIYTSSKASAAGQSATLVFTNGSNVLTFTFANLKLPPESANVSGKTEILLPQTYQAYGTDSEPDIKITNVVA